jgi:hypothetical protein
VIRLEITKSQRKELVMFVVASRQWCFSSKIVTNRYLCIVYLWKWEQCSIERIQVSPSGASNLKKALHVKNCTEQYYQHLYFTLHEFSIFLKSNMTLWKVLKLDTVWSVVHRQAWAIVGGFGCFHISRIWFEGSKFMRRYLSMRWLFLSWLDSVIFAQDESVGQNFRVN